jgi:Ca-activated chloride channel family protein
MTMPTLILTPRRTALLAGHDNVLEVLARILVPEMPAEQRSRRQPLNVALVIDRSGSMSGKPLAEAKRCAEFVIDGLTASDRASLVVYDESAVTCVPTMQLTDREVFRRAIREVFEGGSTNLHGGWLRGAETLAPHTSADSTSRVILLSDGRANVGLTSVSAITSQCQELATAGVTTSTYGLGRSFNEDLMVAMAQAGRGNHYYGQTAEDLMDPFREEFSLLNALAGRQVQLSLTAIEGARIELLNGYAEAGEGGWRLPDLAFGAEAWALVRLHLPVAIVERVGSGEVPILTASVRYDDLAGEPRAIQPQDLRLPAISAAAFAAVAEDPLVKRRSDELHAAAVQRLARTAAMQGDWAAVDELIEQINKLGADNEWVKKIVLELRGLADQRDMRLFAKEALYASRRMSSRLASVSEMSESLEDDVPEYLRRKLAQGKRHARRTPPSS